MKTLNRKIYIVLNIIIFKILKENISKQGRNWSKVSNSVEYYMFTSKLIILFMITTVKICALSPVQPPNNSGAVAGTGRKTLR